MATPQASKSPDPVISQLKEVVSLLGKRDFVAAEGLARQVQRNHPDHAEANNILGAVLVSRKNPAAAAQYLEIAVRKQPQNATYLNNLGCAYLELGLIEMAHAPLTRALALDPKLTKTLWLLGEFYRMAGKPELALPYLEKASRSDPKNADYLWAFGKTLEMLGRKDEARACFEGLRRHPRIGDFALYRLAVNDQHDPASPLLAEIETKIANGAST
jgi:tetratricopeptide (TPR) repeat protein